MTMVTVTPLPWLEMAIGFPLVGAVASLWIRPAERCRALSIGVSFFALLCAIMSWIAVVVATPTDVAAGSIVPESWLEFMRVDSLNGPLVPLAPLLHFLIILATLQTKVNRVSFSGTLASQSLLTATFASQTAWGTIGLLLIGILRPWFDLNQRKQPARVFLLHMGVFSVLLVGGQLLLEVVGRDSQLGGVPVLMIATALLIRCGIAPAHCWVTHLFEHAGFGTALLFVVPMSGVYGIVRLVLPSAPAWVQYSVIGGALVSALYTAGMSLVQRDVRRFYCFLFLSHAGLVLGGMTVTTLVGLTGALCMWLSASMSLAGLGLTLRSVESRKGRLSLTEFHGLSEHVPTLAAFFLITGLASVGFPGTIGFIGVELLMEGAIHLTPLAGIVVVLATALNGLAIMQTYFRIFTGTRLRPTIDMRSRIPEQLAVLILTGLIIGGGLFPQLGVTSRYQAARKLAEDNTRVPMTEPLAVVRE